MLNKKYPIILITIMLFSYLAPLLDNESLEEIHEFKETSSRSTACSGDICISEVLVNAFGAETGAVGPSDWTSGEWVEIHNSGTTTVDLSTWTIEDHSSRTLTMSTNNVVYPTSASNLELAPGDYIVLARNGDGGSCGFCMRNTNGMVNLTSSTGVLVHQISWSARPSEGCLLYTSDAADDP